MLSTFYCVQRIILLTLARHLTHRPASVFIWGAVILASLCLPVVSLAQTSSYVLGPDDVIAISVYEEEGLSFEEIRILDSGKITYPFLGEVTASGNTINSLEEVIRNGLVDGEFLIDPDVTVSIVEYRPFYIDGEVASPGAYPYEPGLTLRRAISIAGGFTERAARSGITVHAAELAENAAPQSYDTLDVPLKPGDVITIRERFF